jgi:hypothetical protein
MHVNAEALLGVAGSVASTLAKGIPALRAAVNGARIGAGAAFGAATLERLGIAVAAEAGPAVRALVPGPLAIALRSKDGLGLRVTALGGVSAGVTSRAVEAMRAVPLSRAALGVGRAGAQGAIAGALIDGTIAAVHAVKAVRSGEMTERDGVVYAATRMARGAAVGGVSVLAAGAASAAVAATGVAVVGAPVVVPIVTMVAVGALVGREIDKRLAPPPPALPG